MTARQALAAQSSDGSALSRPVDASASPLPPHSGPTTSASANLRRWGFVALVAVLVLGAFLRWAMFPGRYELRDVDEVGYVSGGFALLEGVTPAYKNAPGGLLFWTTWAYSAGQALHTALNLTPAERSLPGLLKPFAILDRTLFDLYRDPSGARAFYLAVAYVGGLVGIYAAWVYGRARAAIPGALAAGLLAAALPLFIELGAMSRPYALSWSLSLMALAASVQTGRRRLPLTCLFYGLALGTRIEALLLFPLLVYEYWDRPEPASAVTPAATQPNSTLPGSLVKLAGGSLAIALLVAPWMSANVLGMVRAIATIQVLNSQSNSSLRDTLTELFLVNGLALPALALLFAAGTLLLRPRLRNLLLAAYFALCFTSIFKSTGFGLHHKGPQLIATVAGCVFALQWIQSRRPRTGLVVAALLPLVPVLLSLRLAAPLAFAKAHGPECWDWIDRYIPPGTNLYLGLAARTPLPTRESSDRLWSEVTSLQAPEMKLRSGLERFHLADSAGSAIPLPRAMSEENMIQERSNRRGFYILGSQLSDPRPRFNLFPRTSIIFNSRDVAGDFARNGGVVTGYPSVDSALDGLPPPTIRFPGTRGLDLCVWISPDVLARLPRDAMASGLLRRATVDPKVVPTAESRPTPSPTETLAPSRPN